MTVAIGDVKLGLTMNNTIKLKDKVSGQHIWLNMRDGVVVGAMGSDPSRYLGKTEQRARHMARYGGR